jgi:hypothetical protein
MVSKAILVTLALFLVFAIPVSADITYFDLSDPYNNTGSNDTTPDFHFRLRFNDSSTSAGCELFLDDIGHGLNSSVENDTLTAITSNTSLLDGAFLWNLNCTTNDEFNQESANRLFYVDTIAPNVTLVSPTPETGSELRIYNANPSFTVNATYEDNGIVTGCSIVFNNYSNDMTLYDGYCIGEAIYLQEGSHEYFVQVWDKANVGISDNRTASIDIVTFIEQNRIYAIIVPILWAALALLLFALYELWGKLDHHIILQIGIGILVVIAFIFSISVTLGLVI